MKYLIRDATKLQRSWVPIAPFKVECFAIRVRRVAHFEALAIGVRFRKGTDHYVPRRFNTMPGPIDAVPGTKIFLPSPSPQGHGLLCSPLGARPVDLPAAPSSRHSSLNARSGERRVRRVRLRSESIRGMFDASTLVGVADLLP